MQKKTPGIKLSWKPGNEPRDESKAVDSQTNRRTVAALSRRERLKRVCAFTANKAKVGIKNILIKSLFSPLYQTVVFILKGVKSIAIKKKKPQV
jgi:hypothetical protein